MKIRGWDVLDRPRHRAEVLRQDWAGLSSTREASEWKCWAWDWQVRGCLSYLALKPEEEVRGACREWWGSHSHLSADGVFETLVLHLSSLAVVAPATLICSANPPLERPQREIHPVLDWGKNLQIPLRVQADALFCCLSCKWMSLSGLALALQFYLEWGIFLEYLKRE